MGQPNKPRGGRGFFVNHKGEDPITFRGRELNASEDSNIPPRGSRSPQPGIIAQDNGSNLNGHDPQKFQKLELVKPIFRGFARRRHRTFVCNFPLRLLTMLDGPGARNLSQQPVS